MENVCKDCKYSFKRGDLLYCELGEVFTRYKYTCPEFEKEE